MSGAEADVPLLQYSDIRWRDLDIRKFLCVGLVASIGLDGLTFPVSLVKTRLQVQQEGVRSSRPYYSGTWDVFTKTYRQEGFRAGENFVRHLIGGATAEVFADFIWVPADTISKRLQLQGPLADPKQRIFSGTFDCVQHLVRNEGVGGLYRGFNAALLTNVPFSAVWWATYEYSKRRLAQLTQSPEAQAQVPPGLLQFLSNEHCIHVTSGVVAGTIAAVISNPLDICKSRLQTGVLPKSTTTSTATTTIITNSTTPHLNQVQTNLAKELSLTSTRHGTTGTRTERTAHTMGTQAQSPRQGLNRTFRVGQVLRSLVLEEGWQALTKGMFARVLYTAPMSAMTFAVYEQIKKWSTKS